ncbi:MAG: hypothetical protein U0414_12080 [Polyangiaceae bacterium]
MASLVPCASCARHVRVADVSCPFCGAVRAAHAAGGDALRPRAKRAIAFVAASLSAASCSNATPTTGSATASATATATATASTPSAPATRYGLPPFLAEDELV